MIIKYNKNQGRTFTSTLTLIIPIQNFCEAKTNAFDTHEVICIRTTLQKYIFFLKPPNIFNYFFSQPTIFQKPTTIMKQQNNLTKRAKLPVYLTVYAQNLAHFLVQINRVRTAETYTGAVKSFIKFRNGEDIKLCKLDNSTVLAYEAHLKNAGVSANTSSFYLRNLRAIYNRAVEEGLIKQKFPFRHAYTGISKTVKRAINIEQLKEIINTDLSDRKHIQLAADIFLFSFFTRGTAFIDIAKLRHNNIKNGFLIYQRSKTGQTIKIRIEQCMQCIIDKYANSGNEYLLPILKKSVDIRREYINAQHRTNKHLKILGREIGLTIPLTTYVARHSWASIAHSCQIPIATISDALGHNNEATTRIYIASLDNRAVDDANSYILQQFGTSLNKR